MVPKASGGWRPRGEFRCLNEDATADRYPIPHIQDFTNHLAGTKFFSKIDLVHGYHQIPMRSEDVPKTAVITPFGLFEFLRMPFGLKNGAQAFQRLMGTVSRGLDFIFNYLDYILVASRMWQEHCVHLCLLCQHLSEHSLVVNPSKCQFSLWAIDFLGHHEIRHGEVPPPDRVEAIRQFPQPSTVRGLQEFIGMVTFYHRFIPAAAKIMRPLFQLLSGKRREVHWDAVTVAAFKGAKDALAWAVMLVHPRTDAPTALTVNTSDSAVGAVLEQCFDGQW